MRFDPSFDSFTAVTAGLLATATALFTGNLLKPYWGELNPVVDTPIPLIVDTGDTGLLADTQLIPDLSSQVEGNEDSVDHLNQDLDGLLQDVKRKRRSKRQPTSVNMPPQH